MIIYLVLALRYTFVTNLGEKGWEKKQKKSEKMLCVQRKNIKYLTIKYYTKLFHLEILIKLKTSKAPVVS